MARTQAADYEERREAIVGTAAALFARDGFRGTSMVDLAAACETSKSLFYHYYPSKEDVLYAVMASHIDRLVEEVERVSAEQSDARKGLRTLLHNFMEQYSGAVDRQKVLLNELRNLPPKRQKIIIKKQRRVIEAVQKLLCDIHPLLAEDAAMARVQTMLLFGMINWAHTWFNPSGEVSASAFADMVFERATARLKRT